MDKSPKVMLNDRSQTKKSTYYINLNYIILENTSYSNRNGCMGLGSVRDGREELQR